MDLWTFDIYLRIWYFLTRQKADVICYFEGTPNKTPHHALEHTHGSSGAHYGKDAETYMNIGQAMGQAMVEPLEGGAQ